MPAGATGVAAVCFGRPPHTARYDYETAIFFCKPFTITTCNIFSQFVSQLMDCCRTCGMRMPAGNEVYFHMENNSSPQRVEIAFRTILEKMKNCQLIIVFLQQKGGALYRKLNLLNILRHILKTLDYLTIFILADVKRVGEIQMGIMTQCVVNKTVDRCSPDTLMNIALKINMKCGGINCVLQSREQ